MHADVAPDTTALVVLVPEAEDLVDPFRSRYDPVAPLGMPAHVTILFPFLIPEALTKEALARLREGAALFAPFSYRFLRTDTFPGVLYLRPEEPVPFLAVMGEVRRLFPELVPYGDPSIKPTPHLTVAHSGGEDELEVIRAEFEEQLARHGAVEGLASEVTLLKHAGRVWQRLESFRFGAADAGREP